MKRRYWELAKKRWRRAVWISGERRYALLAHCGGLTITLHDSLAQAEKEKTVIDETACGGRCSRRHEIIDMGETAA
jgi:hypothetical protein